MQVCDIPDNELVFSGIALGYADESSEINTLRSERGDMGEWVSESHDETRPRLVRVGRLNSVSVWLLAGGIPRGVGRSNGRACQTVMLKAEK